MASCLLVSRKLFDPLDFLAQPCRAAAGLPHHQRGGHGLLAALVTVLALHRVQQPLHGARPELGDGHVHGGQRWSQVARDRNVVEAGEGDLDRDLHPRLAQREQAADRHRVVGGEDRRRPRLQGQQPPARPVARLLAEIAAELQPVGGCDPQRAEGVTVAAQPLARVGVLLRSADQRDPPVAQGRQGGAPWRRPRRGCRD